MDEKYEIVKFVDNELELDVNVSPSSDTVWLNVEQISYLFSRGRTTILEHIQNIYLEYELDKNSTCRKIRQVQLEGKRKVIRDITFYNLDVILSVGYRVKSTRGNLFRRWANQVLKQYLLNGYSFNEKRCLNCQDNLLDLKDRVNQIESKINNEKNMYKEKLFYEDQIFDGYSFIKQLLLSAKKEIIIIDGYVDLSVLDMLKEITIPITIYSFPSCFLSNQDIAKFKINHKLQVIKDNTYHDRFLIIDDDIYLLGSSIKDIGKKRSVMTKLNSITKEVLIDYGK